MTPAAQPNAHGSIQCVNAYAAAGLVAAALTGAGQHEHAQDGTQPAGGELTPSSVPGTRLIAAIEGSPDADGLGLEASCGFVYLLRADTAVTLLPAARAAVDALLAAHDWHVDWADAAALKAALVELRDLLEQLSAKRE